MTAQTAVPVEDGASGKYIYGLIPGADHLEFDCPAVGGSIDAVHTVAWNGIAAVTSTMPELEIRPTRRNMIAHARVLESLLRDYPVLPVRFGTIAQDDGAIRGILEAHRDSVRDLFQTFEGKVEFTLKVTWDRDLVLKDVLNADDGLRRMRDDLGKRPASETYYQRIDFGSKMETALFARRDAVAGDILEQCRGLSDEIRRQDVTSDTCVLDVAFLIDRAREEEFDRCAAQIDDALGPAFSCKCVGPSPVYSFIRLNIPWETI